VGIFRLAPDAEDCKLVKQQINSGEFHTTSDVNVIANLIKVDISLNAFIRYYIRISIFGVLGLVP
jgi:hypothetical protein